ncbi:MAG TPA: FMN reductase [Candidatus Limnocylindrales bacterium]|nr:FMN reductase [Candidatus Limnocylindrales bacterium]
MSLLRIVVVSAGLRAPSSTRLLADQLGDAVAASLRSAGQQVEVQVIELRELAHEIADALLTGFPTGKLRTAVGSVAAADGLVVVSPTFSASYSGLFKSFFDLFEADALAGTPALLAATGGTERHSLVLEHALRPLFSYLGASPVRTGVYAATSDFGGASAGRLQARVARAATEVADAVVMRQGRHDHAGGGTGATTGTFGAPADRLPDPFEDVVPFMDLLADQQPLGQTASRRGAHPDAMEDEGL